MGSFFGTNELFLWKSYKCETIEGTADRLKCMGAAGAVGEIKSQNGGTLRRSVVDFSHNADSLHQVQGRFGLVHIAE